MATRAALQIGRCSAPGFRAAVAVAALATSAACRNGTAADDGPPITVGQDDGQDDGDGGPTSAADTSAGSGGFDDSSWAGTAFTGEIHGLVQFTFSPAHALRSTDVIGVVGGYRTAEASWDAEDLYSPVVYFLPFPNVPTAVDTTSFDMMLTAFDYGDEADWVTAGNGIVVRRSDQMGSVTACRQDFTVQTGDTTATYPIYSTGQAGVEQCQPDDPSVWEAGIGYDVLLFGGEAFGDDELLERVQSPPALAVSSPDLGVVGELVSAADGLNFAWDASTVDSRIVIRVVDAAGAVLSAHAADDGAFSLEPADLAMLQPGPIDILVARERADRMLFSAGGVTVVSRYERWGFFELQA